MYLLTPLLQFTSNFTVRVNTAEQVKSNVEKLLLTKNNNGQFNHEDAVTFQAGITCVLKSTFNENGGGNGMVDLLTKDSALPRARINVFRE